MTLPDANLSAPVVRAVMLVFLDVLGDPARNALAPAKVTVPAGMTGDADIDGHSFEAVDPQFVSVGPVTHGEGGTERVTVTLSGTIAGDADILNKLADQANFRGRIGKLWIGLTDEAGALTHLRHFYTGYMAVPSISGEMDSQLISLAIENYLNIIAGGAPSRTILSQREYDANDASGDVTAGTANARSVHGGGSGGGGGGVRGLDPRDFHQR